MNKQQFLVGDRLLLLLMFLVSIIIESNSQAQNIAPKNNFDSVPIIDFIETVEDSSTFNFFFKKEDIKDIKITSTNNELTLSDILSKNLKETGLNYYIDNKENVIIYRGAKITDQLPNYRFSEVKNQEVSKDEESITDIEKRYIEGRNIKLPDLIRVGNSKNFIAGKSNIIRGQVTDQSTGEPVIGATIYIEELKDGTVTDLDGYFQMAIKSGKYQIVANSISMKERRFQLEVNTSGSINITMEKGLVNILEVTVVADRHDNVKGMQMGYEKISAKNIKEIPVVLGEKDLLKIAQMLPGVQSAGEGASGLNVRGGTADQNLFYINRLPIYNTSHLFGFFTTFSPDIVKDFTLYKSNIPAKFGGKVSSVFDISTRQGNKKNFYAQGGISPITVHAAIEGPVIKDKSSFVMSYRGTYSDWLLSQTKNQDLRNSDASFYDLSAAINTNINKKNTLKVFGYMSNDKFSLSTTDDYNYGNKGGSVSLKHFFSSSLNGDFSLVYSNYNLGHNNKNNPSEAYRHEYQLGHLEAKADMTLLTENSHRILFGASVISYNLNRGSLTPYNEESTRMPVNMGVENGIESAIYLSDEFAITPRINLLAGVRFSYYSFLGPAEVNEYRDGASINNKNILDTLYFGKNEQVKAYSGIEPRLSLNYVLGRNNSIKASYNRQNQYMFMLSNTIAISPTDQWKLADYNLKPVMFDQVSLGYYHDFPKKGLETSFEIYKKWGKNIVEYRDGVDFISSDPVEWALLQGKQDSYGAEIMLKKNGGKFTGWVSYCYSRSIITVNNTLSSEQINYGDPYPSNFDRPHTLNFVSTLRSNRRLSMSANLVYSTGRPISFPEAVYKSEGQEYLYYSKRNQYRIPDYFRIDLSINLEGNLKSEKKIHSFWMLNVYNLTSRKNAYSVYFEQKGAKLQAYKLSVFGQPIVTLSWNFKFGNYASE